MNTKLCLFDIEGTTTDIQFVHSVLFPYALDRMESFVHAHHSEKQISKEIEAVKKTVLDEEGRRLELEGVIEQLKLWIKNDRKHGALKNLQGLIWDHGYANGDFKGHLYPDVKPFFEFLRSKNIEIGIYSSGSIHAQKLIFGYSVDGDLTPFISYYFDTQVGGKREVNSYQKIAEETEKAPTEIHFFSDIKEELTAAKEAGFLVTQLLRPGTQHSEFPGVKSFAELM